MDPEFVAKIAGAGWVRQRQIAESVVGLVLSRPADDTAAGLAALAAHEYGDTGALRARIEELGDHPRAQQLRVLAAALDDDPARAARRSVELAVELLGPMRVEQMVERMFAFPPRLLKHTPPSAWYVADREPTQQEIVVAFQNNGKFWYDASGNGPYGGDPTQAMEIYALTQ
ncbi:hypothetical protein [Fodinicola acaciae]|uniref:hypothetical protein n=1 Tax=Fodinicola acaciae TaxID=2681555 RepID=UPI0013D0D6B5|nr:hypothetical protein [Fodinicola acaciae]